MLAMCSTSWGMRVLLPERMENRVHISSKRVLPEELPRDAEHIVTELETAAEGDAIIGNDSESSSVLDPVSAVKKPAALSPTLEDQRNQSCSLFFSLPASPSGLHLEQVKKVIMFSDNKVEQSESTSRSLRIITTTTARSEYCQRDKTYDSFKTWSGRLEKQISNLRGKPQEPDLEANNGYEAAAIPAVERYFDALEGPELDTLKESEVSVLPEDKKWPFLLRFPISSFGMCLGISSQAILWKTLATSPSTSFLRVSPSINLLLWCISLALMATISFIYSFKIVFYFEAVRREYCHPVRVNFFFAPWIACLFLALGAPPPVAVKLRATLWYALMAPIFCLELKIYGQWMSGGQRRLSKVANPSNHLSIVGNFVGALLGASMGLKEGPLFFFAIGLAHYIVLFVTLYQRLPTSETLPKELHPVFFLFVAAPSVACMAWAKIRGEFDLGSKIGYFIALFLYLSLAVRINFFRGFRFSLAWWAYTFPMTGASVAAIRYSMEVTNVLTQALSVGLSAISTFTVTALLVTTILHAFVLHDLFPNDISIAITQKKKPKLNKILAHLRSFGSDIKDADNSKEVTPDEAASDDVDDNVRWRGAAEAAALGVASLPRAAATQGAATASWWQQCVDDAGIGEEVGKMT
ncbi:S-type anion channel SLAH2-like [Canna indica]|uniref:S-type anion channel SLAH2-like n=1 Tax=Canna indica TaxID=4628 RepID=A0AAQ3LBE0_9LILI|nr:S-type anion channel SLAH2-like [Canna indica]